MYSNSNANDAYTPDVEIVATNTGGDKVTKLPFGDEDVKAKEYNSPKFKRWRDQVAETATLLGITGSTRNKKFLIAGLGSAALLALAWSVPSMKESHVNKNSAAVIRKPASAKSSKVPVAKAAKSSCGGGDEGPLSLCYEYVGDGFCAVSQAPQDSDILPYVYFGGSAGSSPSACASKCTECVSVDGAVSDGSFRGFTRDIFQYSCFCHVDVGSTYNSPGAGCESSYGDEFGAGTGEILGVVECDDDGGDVVCYKYKLPEE